MCECLPILLFFIRWRSLRSSGMLRGKIQTFVQICRMSSSREKNQNQSQTCITHPDRTPSHSVTKVKLQSRHLLWQIKQCKFISCYIFSFRRDKNRLPEENVAVGGYFLNERNCSPELFNKRKHVTPFLRGPQYSKQLNPYSARCFQCVNYSLGKC